MRVTDQQVRKLRMEYQKTGRIGLSALKAGMHRETASEYIHSGLLPSESKKDRTWRTRPNPFAAHWAEAVAMLEETPELEAKALFDWLTERYPGHYQEGQLRTFQRHVRQWRALHGPEKEVFFPQVHLPGDRLATDFTCMNGLKITIGGVPFDHLLCHSVLTYSNWQWATICHSESFLALRSGLQEVLVELGRVPREHWTDHSTAATHRLGGDQAGRRGFNAAYLEFMEHVGMQPHTINVGRPNENGDIESANGALKRRIRQHLLLRGSRDFASRDEYWRFLKRILHQANTLRRHRFLEDHAAMRPLTAPLLPAYIEEQVKVSRTSTIQTDRRVYSVPSRLIGQTLRVRRHEQHVEVWLGTRKQLRMPRLTGKQLHHINYRHVIGWLIRKPGAFAQYRFREDLFPSLVFRRAYDRLSAECSPRTADLEYLRILRQAARTMECEVERALLDLEKRGVIPRWETLMKYWPAPQAPDMPDLVAPKVELSLYDALLDATEVR